MATPIRRATTEDDITAEVLQRFEATSDPRLRRVMLSLAGHLCDDKRQEFILLSDTLGASMIVDLINHRKPEGATESTVFGPFHREGAPEMPPGGNIAPKDAGSPT